MSKTYFETERLIIREADERDIEDLYELYTDANVLKYNCIPPLTRENIRDGIESGEYSFCIELKGEGKVIGAVGFCNNGNMRHDVPSRCISYELNTKYTKKGYMTEAVVAFLRYCFEELGVDVVSARVFDEKREFTSYAEASRIHRGGKTSPRREIRRWNNLRRLPVLHPEKRV